MFKKILTKTHSLLGCLLSVVFVIWFTSGFVMIFEGFPHVLKDYQFNKQVSFSSSDSLSKLPEALTDSLSGICVEKINSKPVYHIKYKNANETTYNAVSLLAIDTFNATDLDSLIKKNYGVSYNKREEINDFDQWIPWSHFDKYFPIYKYYLNDDKHSVIYTSLKTCSVVQETTRRQRWCARFGAIPHWFYFKSLRLKRDLWIDIVVWIALIGCIMSLSGIILGFFRKRRTKQAGMFNFSPYKKKWYKWHHVTGYIFGFFVLTFVFSGLMSLYDVPKWLVPIKETANYKELFSRKPKNIEAYQLSVNRIFNDKRLVGVRKIEWKQIANIPYYFAYLDNLNDPIMVKADKSDSVCINRITKEDIEAELIKKLPNTKYESELLKETDGYINFSRLGSSSLLKVVLKDANNTWLYFNMNKAELASQSNSNTRLRRWLYKGLHSLDFKFLQNHEWLRKLLLILLSLFGTVISFSGLVLSYNYITRKIKKIIR